MRSKSHMFCFFFMKDNVFAYMAKTGFSDCGESVPISRDHVYFRKYIHNKKTKIEVLSMLKNAINVRSKRIIAKVNSRNINQKNGEYFIIKTSTGDNLFHIKECLQTAVGEFLYSSFFFSFSIFISTSRTSYI